MSSTYWCLDSPYYSSDYQDTFINGSGQHLFGLPGVNCSVCKKTYGGKHILPYPCPEKFQQNKYLRQRWPIPEHEHMRLRQELKEELQATGISLGALPPVYDFQPVHLKFPSRPKRDFLWPTLGSAVVSPRVKRLFERHTVSGVTFCPAVIDKVGKRASKGPIPIASTGEPEDIIEEVEPEQDPTSFGPLYEMVVTSESGRPPGAEVISRCEACGREEYDNSERRLVLTQTMIPEADVFFLARTVQIIVNDRVRYLILRHRLTNVDFTRYDVPMEDDSLADQVSIPVCTHSVPQCLS